MKGLSPRAIAKACNGRYYGPEALADKEVSSVTIDSRKIEKDTLFIPIKGARVDGHTFINQVIDNGSLCSLSEIDLEDIGDRPYIRVESTRLAIRQIAKLYLDNLGTKVVGITGSVGKTSTKEMIAAVLGQKYRVLKTEGNFNNEIGLPLTVFRLSEDDEIAVLEMGISHFGDMDMLAEIATPEIGVFTNIAECHLEFLGDRDGVLKAKTEMFKFLDDDGVVVLNSDDDKLATVHEVNGRETIKISATSTADVYASDIESKGIEGTICTINTNDAKIRVHIAIPGKHMVYNALTAAAVGLQCGLSLEEIKAGIESAKTLSGRCNIMHKNNLTIIDDCYNANPQSMRAAIDLLSMAETRKIAILGDMFELGSDELELHYNIGKYAVEKGIDYLICIGERSLYMSKGAGDSKELLSPSDKNYMCKVIHLPNLDSIQDIIKNLFKDGDTILLKASHAMGFEEIIKMI